MEFNRNRNCFPTDFVNVFDAQLRYIVCLIKFVLWLYTFIISPRSIRQIFQPSFSLRRFSTHFHWDIHIILETFIYKSNLHNRIFNNQRDLNSSLKLRSQLYRQNNKRSCFVNYLNIFQQTCGFNSKIYMLWLQRSDLSLFQFNFVQQKWHSEPLYCI